MARRIDAQPLPSTRSVHRPQELEFNAYRIDARRMGWRGSNFNRASLRAILAGTLIGLAVMVGMGILGVAIGMTTLNAMIDTNQDPMFDIGTGAVVWIALSNLLALFVGGWVAGRLAGVPDKLDGALHGLVTFGLVALISLWMVTSSTAWVISSVAGAVGQGLDLIGEGVAAASPAAADAVERRGITLQEIEEEARSLLSQTGDPALQPGAVESQTEQAGETATDAASGIIQQPSAAAREIERTVDRFLSLDAVEEADRQDLVNVLVARTDMTEQEARQAVDRWEATYSDVFDETEKTITSAADSLTEAIAAAAGVMFLGFVLGAFAAGAGGWLGAPNLHEFLYPGEEEEDVDTEEA